MTAVVLMVLFATVSSSFAKPQKYGRGGKNVVRDSCRSRRARSHKRGAGPRHIRKVFLEPHYRNSIVVSIPWSRKVVVAPSTGIVVVAPQQIIEPTEITVWITNDNGSLTAVTLTRCFPGYIGPLGEYYATMPTEEQLKILYGLKPVNYSHPHPPTDQ